jgi:pimeloyl-ACP methyl ester carboxylesterase
VPKLEIDGMPMQFVDEGNGHPVVLLHGGISSSRQWRSLIDRLSGRYRLLAPDFIGQGGTTNWDRERPFGFHDEWRLVEAMFDMVDGPVHLVGHSYGGWIAVDGALGVLDRLKSLTLIEPSAFHLLRYDKDTDAWSEAQEIKRKLIECLRESSEAQLAPWFMEYWVGPGSWQAMPDDGKAMVQSLLPVHAMGALAMYGQDVSLEDYARIDVPTLLVRGSETVLPSHRVVDLLAAVIPDCELVEIEGAGHTSPMTHTEQVNAVIEAHLDHARSASTNS